MANHFLKSPAVAPSGYVQRL